MRNLPEDWFIKRGKEILRIINGISTSNLDFESDGSLLYLKVSDMNNPKNKPYIFETENKCILINESLITNILDRDTIVFPKRGAAIFTNKVGIMGKRGTLDPNLMAVTPKHKDLYFKYLYYYLEYFNLSNICENAGLPQLNIKDLDPLKFIYPPFIQQLKIVSILENVDNLIQTTQRLIETLQECKKGLMQRLFTGGIGHTEFKDSKLGQIPIEWEIKKLSELSEIIMGQSPPSSSYNEDGNGLPFFQGNADFGFLHPKIKFWCNSPTRIAEVNDILISVRAPVGALNIANLQCCIGRGLASIRVEDYSLRFYVFYYLFNYNQLIKNYSQGSTFEAINKQDLFNLKLTVPQDQYELSAISEILINVDSLILNEYEYKRKLNILKKGLMQILLTGKKGVYYL